MKLQVALATACAAALAAGNAFARDQIQVVGSSTVFPYSQAASEEFSNNSGMPAPVVESTGTGGGMKIFCQGIGEAHPDITGASRAMKVSEWELCNQNGVTDITEVLLGYDGITIARSRAAEGELNVSESELFLALSSHVPVNGEWVENPYTQWSEINPNLPAVDILVYGPPPTSGTRDAFVELGMHDGCAELDYVKDGGFDGDWVEENCSRMRQDGPFVEAGENDNLIVQRLEADPTALGIFGYSFLFENQDKLEGIAVNGVTPTAETIADFSYDIARPVYFYIKNAHRGVIPGLSEFIAEYVSDTATGPDGYLVERGLTPVSDTKRQEVQEAAMTGRSMVAPGS